MALAHGPTPLFRTDGAILIELLNVIHKLFPAHIPHVMIPQHDRPVAAWHPAISRFAARRFSREDARPALRSSIDIGSGIERIVQHREDPAMPQARPLDFSFPVLGPKPIRNVESLPCEVL